MEVKPSDGSFSGLCRGSISPIPNADAVNAYVQKYSNNNNFTVPASSGNTSLDNCIYNSVLNAYHEGNFLDRFS